MATGDARYLATVNKRRALLLVKRAEEAERANVEAMRKLAVENSSGTAYNPSLDRSRPYARRAPHPPLPPWIANVQTGLLRAGWRTETTRQGADIRADLFNVAPESRFFGGEPTRTMIARPLLQNVVERSRKPAFQRMTDAVRRALRIG